MTSDRRKKQNKENSENYRWKMERTSRCRCGKPLASGLKTCLECAGIDEESWNNSVDVVGHAFPDQGPSKWRTVTKLLSGPKSPTRGQKNSG